MTDKLTWPKKDPSDVLDYQIDWASALGADTIASSVWTAPAGYTVNSNSFTPTTTTVWLSGGTPGTVGKITNRITTAGGRTIERSVQQTVEEL